MKFFIYMLFIGLLIDPVISQASSNICPNLNGLYKDGAETECYRYQGQDGAVHIYFCQNYKIVSQSGCEKIALFEKN